MVRFVKSKSGLLAALSKGVYLNSRYNPLEEARRVVTKKLESKRPKTVIILGETIGYLTQAVSAHSPGCRCVQVYYDSALYDMCSFRTADFWHPKTGVTHEAFFRNAIHELEIDDLAVIEWAPSAAVYPETAKETLTSLSRTIAICNGNISTTLSFGRRWLRNIVHNYLAAERISRQLPKADLVVVAAAGPSLEYSLDLFLENRSSFFLIALPSSLSALLEKGLTPDLLVITDPGYYSAVHLAPVGQRKLRTAMPYTAVREASRYASEIVLLNQGTFLENAVLTRSGIPHLRIDQIGTVAGTALFLAGVIGKAVVLAGLDLSHRDIQTHVRPHAFDPLVECSGKRTLPVQTIKYLRGFENRLRSDAGAEIGPFKTYSGWLNSAALPDIPLYRLYPTAVPVDGMAPIDAEAFSSLCAGKSRLHYSRECAVTPSTMEKKRILLSILNETKDVLQRVNQPAGRRDYTKPTALSTLYFASAGTLLKALKSPDSGVFKEAVAGAVNLLDELTDYVCTWPA